MYLFTRMQLIVLLNFNLFIVNFNVSHFYVLFSVVAFPIMCIIVSTHNLIENHLFLPMQFDVICQVINIQSILMISGIYHAQKEDLRKFFR